MPQMDFTSFFPQVFWLILFVCFYFIFFLKGFFSTCVAILKMRGIYLFIFIYLFKKISFNILFELIVTTKLIVIKYISFFNLYSSFNSIIKKNLYFFNNLYFLILQEDLYFTFNFSNNILIYLNNLIKYDSFYFYFNEIEFENDDNNIDFTDENYVINFVEFLTSFYDISDLEINEDIL